jgi:hypothetical protein
MTREQFAVIDYKLRHAIQTGVAFETEGAQEDTKHLRTGINCALAEISGIAHMLIKKGVITLDEYYDCILWGLGEEVKRYENSLSEKYGKEIKLG